MSVSYNRLWKQLIDKNMKRMAEAFQGKAGSIHSRRKESMACRKSECYTWF